MLHGRWERAFLSLRQAQLLWHEARGLAAWLVGSLVIEASPEGVSFLVKLF